MNFSSRSAKSNKTKLITNLWVQIGLLVGPLLFQLIKKKSLYISISLKKVNISSIFIFVASSAVRKWFSKILVLFPISAGQVVNRCSGVSSSSLHILHVAVWVSSILCRCLFSLQCPVIAPIMSLRSCLDLFSRNLVFLLFGPSIMVLLSMQLVRLFQSFLCWVL